ncbi:hypothetical protein Pyrfu_1495 [Pyrolobus fumarii 1A]|uniref:Uncharacterized protein n=1 Tax=Pyrolobus fumarii (strain DSM 11204 / 1A) TaxID=694429 RepID=G0EHK0_PYRF1|nr:C2H2-type zinc finger protein [Pyrolobus fumarii]AEM39353.1 hypothetical protein Pyrfu_1495 [Pyrolobus fumarii 1A]
MALQWEPQWEELVIEKWGVKLKVKKDKVTGMYACPICGISDSAIYFFSIEDLLRHMLTHARRERIETIRVSIEEGEEGAKLEEIGEES